LSLLLYIGAQPALDADELPDVGKDVVSVAVDRLPDELITIGRDSQDGLDEVAGRRQTSP
jgi:hypothetical protein